MKCAASVLLLGLASAVLCSVAQTADKEEKPVRLVWFPRFSPDGKWLLTPHGSWDQKEAGEARLFSAEDGKVKYVLRHPRGVRTVAWSTRGDFFATGAYGGGVRIFELTTGKSLHEFNIGSGVENVRMLPDDNRLLASLGSGDVRVYDVASHQELHNFKGAHQGGIWGMAVSPSGKYAATAGKDTFVRVWNLDSFELVHEIKHPSETNGLAFTPNGQYLATGCGDSLIRLFDVATATEQAQCQGHELGSVTDLQFTSDSKLLASSGMDQTARIWDLSDFKHATLKQTLRGHTGLVFGVAISPDDRYLASAGWDEQVIMRDLNTGTVRWKWARK
jgi:WD40 repeat protein